MIDIEREKREKKENILKIAKQVEEAAKDSYKELENQGIQLKKTQKDVREIDQYISKVDKNLANIEEYRRGTFRTCLGLLCCCRYCMQSGKQQVPRQRIALDLKSTKLSLNEEHLPPDRIEKEWCMRYDPEDRWIKQVELGLDCLLKLADQMKRSFDEQTELAEQIYLNVKTNQTRIKDSRQRMKKIQESPTKQ